MMTRSFLVFLCFIFFSLLIGNREVESTLSHNKTIKLFVLGDSYADTGNNNKSSSSWQVPYGITFPGKPSGRFSDGRLLTDFLARFFGIKSPIAYQLRNNAPEMVQYGMNFAYGGSGVFNTTIPYPNMTIQIDFFQQLINNSVYSQQDLEASVVFVTLSGNDYSTFISQNSSAEALQAFIPQVVNQLAANLKRIHSMGVKKVVVTSLQPLGCLPRSTAASSFQSCNASENTAVSYHNILLSQAVADLKNKTDDSAFAILDLYDSFVSVLNINGTIPGSSKFQNPLKLCCAGINSSYSCGSIGDDGEKKYTICDKPGGAFFWDTVHPTQVGWRAVYLDLKSTLEKNFK